jgi:hypothetical protein
VTCSGWTIAQSAAEFEVHPQGISKTEQSIVKSGFDLQAAKVPKKRQRTGFRV